MELRHIRRAVAAMEGFSEFNIGHSIIARAVFVGLRQAVAEMNRMIHQARETK